MAQHEFSSSMESAARSSRAPRRAQRLLPALTPAPPSSSSAFAAPLKLEQPTDSSRPAAPPSKKPSSIAHVFFNRRPLDLIRRTTSSLLATASNSAPTAVAATPPVAEERKFWQPHRPHGEKNGRRRLQQLQHKDKTKDDHRQQQQPQWRLRLGGEVEHDVDRKRHETVEIRRRPAPCPPSGKQFLLSAENAAELTALERVEILQYDEIRFVSTRVVKRSRRNGRIQNDLPVHGDDAPMEAEEDPEDLPMQLYNDGYDDEHGDYLVLMGDHLAFRYEVLSALGQGSFGQVVCCLDHRTRKQVAVKIIRNRRKYRDQALLEVELLGQLQRAAEARDENPHVVRMEEYFQFRDHVCIVFEVLGTNLYDFLKMRYFHGLPMSSVRTVGKQLAQSLAFLKQQQVVHCDLKPENVLLDASALAGNARSTGILDNVTLIDFGSSCLERTSTFTYIQSRFYRSPEVLLGNAYSGAIDMWSFACILVELHTGHPIFAGENEREQFACIMEILDVPPVDIVSKSKRRLNFFDEVANPADVEAVDYVPKPFVNSRGRRRIPGLTSLASAVKTEDPEFLAFLAKCFVWDPSQRLTPEQALQEPWMRHHRHQQHVANPVEYEL